MEPNGEDGTGASSAVLQPPSKTQVPIGSPLLPDYDLRPFRQTCSVRSRYEEAAVRYASATRTTALFPPAPSGSDAKSNNNPGPVPVNCLWNYNRTAVRRWTSKNLGSSHERANQSVVPNLVGQAHVERPVHPVMPTLHSDAHPLTPSTPPLTSSEQEDSIGRGIAEMRYEFVPSGQVSQPSSSAATVLFKPKGIHAKKALPTQGGANKAVIPPAVSDSCTQELASRDNLVCQTVAANEEDQVSVNSTAPWQMTSYSTLSPQQPVNNRGCLGKMETCESFSDTVASEHLSDDETLRAKDTDNKSQYYKDISKALSNVSFSVKGTEIGDKPCNSLISEADMEDDLLIVFDKNRNEEVPNFVILSSDSSVEMRSLNGLSHSEDNSVFENNEQISSSYSQTKENESTADLPNLTNSIVLNGDTPSILEDSVEKIGVEITLDDNKKTKCSQNDETDSLASTIIFDPVCGNEKVPMKNHKQDYCNATEVACQMSPEIRRDELKCGSSLHSRHDKGPDVLLQSSARLSPNTSESLRPEQSIHVDKERNDLRKDLVDASSMESTLDESIRREEDINVIANKSALSENTCEKMNEPLEISCGIMSSYKQHEKKSDAHCKFADSVPDVVISHGDLILPTHNLPSSPSETTSGLLEATFGVAFPKKESEPDCCRYADPSATVFVSDGVLILPIHTQEGLIVDFVDVVRMLHDYKHSAEKRNKYELNELNMTEDNRYITIEIDVQRSNGNESISDGKLAVKEEKKQCLKQGVEKVVLNKKGFDVINQEDINGNQGKSALVWQEVMNLSGVEANDEVVIESNAVYLENSTLINENSISQSKIINQSALANRKNETVDRNVTEHYRTVNVSAMVNQDFDVNQENVNIADARQEVVMNSKAITQYTIVNKSTDHEGIEYRKIVPQETALDIVSEELVTDNITTTLKNEDHKDIESQIIVACQNNIVNQKQETITTGVNSLNFEKSMNDESILLKQNNVVMAIDNTDVNKNAIGNQEVCEAVNPRPRSTDAISNEADFQEYDAPVITGYGREKNPSTENLNVTKEHDSTHCKEHYSDDKILIDSTKLFSCATTVNDETVSIIRPNKNNQLGFYCWAESKKCGPQCMIDQGTRAPHFQLKGPLTLDGTMSSNYHPVWKQKYLGTIQEITYETMIIYGMKKGKHNAGTFTDVPFITDTRDEKNVKTQVGQDPVISQSKNVHVKGIGKKQCTQIRKENAMMQMIYQRHDIFEEGKFLLQDLQESNQDNSLCSKWDICCKPENSLEVNKPQEKEKQNDGKSCEVADTTDGKFVVECLPFSGNIKLITNNSEQAQDSKQMKGLPKDFVKRIAQKVEQLKGKTKQTQHLRVYRPLQNKRQHDFIENLEKFMEKYQNTKHANVELPLKVQEQSNLVSHEELVEKQKLTSDPSEDTQTSKHETRVEDKVLFCIRNENEDIKRKAESLEGDTPQGRKNKKRNADDTLKSIGVQLDELHTDFIKVLQTEGEVLLSSMKGKGEGGVIGRHQHFSTLQPDHTRFLLNHLLRLRTDDYREDRQYRKVLMLHGLVKAADLLTHYGVSSATLCLREFQNTHPVLMPEGYVTVLASLKRLQEGASDLTHPKVKVIMEEMARVRLGTDPKDADLKILILMRRQSSAVYQQLKRHLGQDAVCCLESFPSHRDVLLVLETYSVVLYEEQNGLQDLPYSQFSLVFQWEADGEPSPCVSHCVRQNIHVIALSTMPSTIHRIQQGLASREEISAGSRIDESKDEKVKDDNNDRLEKGHTTVKKGLDPFTLIASSRLINNAELHYIITSVFNIILVERSLRDLVDSEDCKRGWADLVVDERTCILLQPLAHLRTDTHVHYLIRQLVLLSLQCATCYLILYSEPRLDCGYIFRSNVVKALTRLVAACAQFRSQEYTVSICLAHNLHQHERFLLALPCINSITAQVILTAVPLPKLLTSPLASLVTSLPWLPCKVIALLHKLLHGGKGENRKNPISNHVENPLQGNAGGVVPPYCDDFRLLSTSSGGEQDVNPCTNEPSKQSDSTYPTCTAQHSTNAKGKAENVYFDRNPWEMTNLDQSTPRSLFDNKQLVPQHTEHHHLLQHLKQESPFQQNYSVHVIPQQKQLFPPSTQPLRQPFQQIQHYPDQQMHNIDMHSEQFPYFIQRKPSETLANAARSEQQAGNLHFTSTAPSVTSPYFERPFMALSPFTSNDSLNYDNNCSGAVDFAAGLRQIYDHSDENWTDGNNENFTSVTENSTYVDTRNQGYWHGQKSPEPKRSFNQERLQTMPLVPPSPKVILRQSGRSHHFPDECNPSPLQCAGPLGSKKLRYHMVSGTGGQTKLFFENL
ncbi:uncharacterized protein LOC122256302 isoform X3 [Penaeus japonicus]|uniref:uncharacterized protein LOC122256302 isoform X3 n=1 Tax=Penaeus japonicus TaxID=27405 RepID=UPI001C7171DA|nr:uncharacterized protein LOC122256302 isoform X3 [Penaeus japonicus]